jgi:membrane-bound lytic murein transglycosylase B
MMQSMVAAVFALSLGVCPMAASQQPPPNPLPVVQLPPQTFAEWLTGFRSEASSRGISDATLDRALTGLEPLPIVVERDRTQAELVLTLDQYLDRRLTRPMIKAAQKMAAEHRALLRKVSAKYGVPAGVIVAIWGLESNYGRFSGVRPTIATLATLAYNPRRSAMFREELFNALKILDSGDIDPAAMRGSWAGALGQPQFMPSSFLEFAQDFDGDGKRDIWKSTPDVFASIANYLSAQGWTKGKTWGREVKVPPAIAGKVADAAPLQTTGCLAERQMSVALPLSEWRQLGVKSMSGAKLPAADVRASLVAAGSRRFLIYPNYQALLAYNCVHAYGLSVALLSDRVH